MEFLISMIAPPEDDSAVGKLTNWIMDLMMGGIPKAYELFIMFLVIGFLGGVVFFAVSIMMKNGVWQKNSLNTMITTFIFFMAAHLIPILVLTNSVTGFTLIVTSILEALKEIGIRVSIILILVGLAFRLYYLAEEHPGYLRRSKMLYVGASCIFALSFFVPKILDIL